MPTASLSVTSMAELIAAVDQAHSTAPGTDWTVYLADGDYGVPGGKSFLSGKVFAGRVIDPNAGKDTPARNPKAIATVTGGSVTFKARRAMRARIVDRLQVTGSGPFLWSGIDFVAAATTDSGLQPDGTYVKGQSHATAQFNHTTNSSYPALTGQVLRKCRFGGLASGTLPSRWILGAMLDGTDAALTVVEDCTFEGCIIAANATVIRRNTVRQQATDAFRMGFGAGVQPRHYFYGNTVLDSFNGPTWEREHCDGLQVGSVNTDSPIYIEVYDNVFASRAKMQPIYMDDSRSTISGIVQDNFMATTNTNGINLWNPENMTLRRNTAVTFPGGDPTQNKTLIRTGKTGNNVLLEDNWGMNDPADPAKTFLTITGHRVIPFTSAGYNAAFMGDFGTGPAPLAAIDLTRRADVVRADLLARFARR